MERRRGLIVERSGKNVTVLTRDGGFVTFKSSREDVMPGMEIAVPSARGFTFFTWRRLVPVVALSLVLAFSSFFGYQQYLYAQPLMAYVTLDYAGSVELEVNGAGLVKAATALDEAGQQALSSVEYENRPAQQVVEALVAAQEKTSQQPPVGTQAVTQEPSVVVAVVPVKPGPAAAVDNLEKKVSESAAPKAKAQDDRQSQVTTFRLDMETRDSAKELGISAGRAAMWALSKHEAEGRGEQTDHPGNETPGQVTPSQVTPGQVTPSQVTPGQPTQGNETPGQGQGPSGNGGKGQTLDDVKHSLPKVDTTELDKQKGQQERDKYMKDITKDWVNRMVEEIRKEKDSENGPGKDSGKNSQASQGNGHESSPGQSKSGSGKGSVSPQSSPQQGGGKSSPTSQTTGSGQNYGQQTDHGQGQVVAGSQGSGSSQSPSGDQGSGQTDEQGDGSQPASPPATGQTQEGSGDGQRSHDSGDADGHSQDRTQGGWISDMLDRIRGWR